MGFYVKEKLDTTQRAYKMKDFLKIIWQRIKGLPRVKKSYKQAMNKWSNPGI